MNIVGKKKNDCKFGTKRLFHSFFGHTVARYTSNHLEDPEHVLLLFRNIHTVPKYSIDLEHVRSSKRSTPSVATLFQVGAKPNATVNVLRLMSNASQVALSVCL